MTNATKGALALVAGLVAPGAVYAEWAPNRPVEFIVAAGPGGGSDTFARVVQSALTKNELLDTQVIVTNKAGGSGAEAFVYAKTDPEDPYKLYFGTQDAYVLPLSSKISYSASEDLQPVGALAFDPFLLWVNPERSGIEDVAGFLAKARENPGKVRVGGAKAKEADETLMTLIERAGEVELTYIPFKSGSEAAIQVAGGHIEANVNNPSESLEQWKAGIQKPLCLFQDERLTDTTPVTDDMSWADVPTCREAGLDVQSFAQPRTVWMAANAPPEAVAYFTDLMQKAVETPEFAAYVQRGYQIPNALFGDDLRAFITGHEAEYREIYSENGWLRTN